MSTLPGRTCCFLVAFRCRLSTTSSTLPGLAKEFQLIPEAACHCAYSVVKVRRQQCGTVLLRGQQADMH